MEKLIITAAVTGGEYVSKATTPYVPSTTEEIVKIDMSGAVLEGFTKPSSEIKMHLAIYEDRSDVCGIVHGHPPTATGYAAARVPVPTEILTEAATGGLLAAIIMLPLWPALALLLPFGIALNGT